MAGLTNTLFWTLFLMLRTSLATHSQVGGKFSASVIVVSFHRTKPVSFGLA